VTLSDSKQFECLYFRTNRVWKTRFEVGGARIKDIRAMGRAMNFKIFNRLQSRQKVTWLTRDASSATSRSALLSKSSNAFKCIPNATENVQLPKKKSKERQIQQPSPPKGPMQCICDAFRISNGALRELRSDAARRSSHAARAASEPNRNAPF
jgi:hypothetical protein